MSFCFGVAGPWALRGNIHTCMPQNISPIRACIISATYTSHLINVHNAQMLTTFICRNAGRAHKNSDKTFPLSLFCRLIQIFVMPKCRKLQPVQKGLLYKDYFLLRRIPFLISVHIYICIADRDPTKNNTRNPRASGGYI